MKQNFFITLREIKESLSDSKNPNYVNITDETRKGFKEFTSFVEECDLFPGKRFYAIQYACKYWYLSGVELRNRCARETGKQISNSAISQTLTRASMAYSKVFGIFDLYEVFDGKHDNEIKDLLLLCDLIVEDKESGLIPMFIDEVYNYNTSKKHGVYKLEECLSEIAILKKTMRSSIYDKLDNIDDDKLLYLLDVSKQSLFNTKDDTINQTKFRLLTYLKGGEYAKYNNLVGFENIDEIGEEQGSEDSENYTAEILADKNSEGYSQSVSEDETLDFDFDKDLYEGLDSDNAPLEDTSEKGIDSIENSLEEVLAYIQDFPYEENVFDEVDEKEVLKATKFLTLYTKEGLDKYLKGLSKDVMEEAFKKLLSIGNK